MNKMKNFTFRKRLLALTVCAFAWIGANAQTIDQTDNSILIFGPNDVGKDFGNFSSEVQAALNNGSITTIKLVGEFPYGWSGGWLKNSDTPKSSITSIDLYDADLSNTTATGPNANGDIESTNGWVFYHFQNENLEITWPKPGFITVIPGYAFSNTGLQTVSIPGYIQYICDQAFDSSSSDPYLKSIIFEEYKDDEGNSLVNMKIGRQAFSNTYALLDVYINSKGNITAANNAFPHSDTYGHGNVTAVLATLHFPPEKAADYANLSHPLTEAIASNDKDFQEWLVAHYSLAGDKKNGFYEFVSNGIAEEDGPDWGDQFLTTYSFTPKTNIEDLIDPDVLAQAQAEGKQVTIAQVVPPGVKAFIVNSISKTGDKFYLTLKRVNVIPANTGVILFGGTNSTSSDGTKKILSMKLVAYIGEYFNAQNTTNTNYLTPTCSDTPDYRPYLQPYHSEYGHVYRDFIMTKFQYSDYGVSYNKKYPDTYGLYDETETPAGLPKGDWVGFFRSKKGYGVEGKAILQLDQDDFSFSLADCGEIIIDVAAGGQLNSSNKATYYRTEYVVGDQNMTTMTEAQMKKGPFWYIDDDTPITWEGLWGIRDLNSGWTGAKYMAEFEDKDWMENVLSGVSSVKAEKNKNSSIYTLQGVKVAQPQKGIYIQNGKKMIIK